MPKPAARVGDPHDCSEDIHSGGEIVEGSPNISIEGKPAARVGDKAKCENGGDNLIQKGSATVFFNDKPAARVDDNLEHGGVITAGASNVFIGSGGGRVSFGSRGNIQIGTKGKVIIGRKSAAANPAPGVSCPIAIGEIQKETDAIANMDDKIARNKKITAAYVKLYQENPNLEWAHTAIYASKQVGCALRRGYAIAGKENTFFDKITTNIKQNLIINALAEGNNAVFKDVYPILRFYNKYTLVKIKECYDMKTSLSNKNIYNGLDEIEKGKNEHGSTIILEHEQKNVLQQMYDKFIFSILTRLNHVGGVISGAAKHKATSIEATNHLTNNFITNSLLKEIKSAIAHFDSASYKAASYAIDFFIQPEKVSLTSDCIGGVEHDMSDIDIRDVDQRIHSAAKLMKLVIKNGYENYSAEQEQFSKMLANAEQ